MANAIESGQSRENLIVVIIALAIAFFVLIQVYQAYSVSIHGGLVTFAKWLLWPIQALATWLSTFGYFEQAMAWPERLYVGIGNLESQPLSFKEVRIVYAEVGKFYNWILIPLLIWGFFRVRRKHVKMRFSRQLDMKKLLRQNVALYPILAPVAYRDLDKEPLFEGRWRMAMSAVEWGVRYGIIKRGSADQMAVPSHLEFARGEVEPPAIRWTFDTGQAKRALVAQLGIRLQWDQLPVSRSQEVLNQIARATAWLPGPLRISPFNPITEPVNVPDYMLALAGVFMAFASNKRAQAREALDAMALSYKEGKNAKKDSLDARTGVELYYRFQDRFVTLSEQHSAWSSVWLMALYSRAQESGSLPPCEFIWLRPHDRTLWYTLNQVGRGGEGGHKGHVAWAEAAGVAAHYDAECVLGSVIEDPAVEVAIDQIGDALFREGWIGERI